MVILSSSGSAQKTKVLIVDDSALMRKMLSDILESDPALEVVGLASDPFVARDRIKALNPDVITLDINMPRMDGLSFLEKIMTLRPMPVVMISTLTEKGAKETLEALELGAVDYITKPTTDLKNSFERIRSEICAKVKVAAKARVKNRLDHKVSVPSLIAEGRRGLPQLVAIGSSTGGVEALTEVFRSLPAHCPPVVVVQHMPAGFTASFAARLNKQCQPTVVEVQPGMRIEKGTIYIAPGDRHFRLKHASSAIVADLYDGETVSGHKPSVDVLFHSVAALKMRYVQGIILTGMGRDGAKGLLELRQNGARTFGQNESSCLVYGMPRAAMELGSVEQEIPLQKVSSVIMGHV